MTQITQRHADQVTLDHLVYTRVLAARYESALAEIQELITDSASSDEIIKQVREVVRAALPEDGQSC